MAGCSRRAARVAGRIQASIASVSAISASLTVEAGGVAVPLAATVASVSTLAADLKRAVPLAASVVGQSGAGAVLLVAVPRRAVVSWLELEATAPSGQLAASVGGQSTVTASLTVTAGGGGLSAMTLGTRSVWATPEQINVVWPFTGDDDANATVEARFKKLADLTWRNALPPDNRRNDAGTTRRLNGAILLCDPSTEYVIEWTIRDGTESQVETFNVTTPADDVPAASSLTVTHHVRIGGSDSNDGLTTGTAWATVQKAVTSAPADAVVQLGPGSFARATSARSAAQGAITFVAEFPALDDSRAVINSANHSRIIGGVTAAPGSGVWTQLSPFAEQPTWTVWRWLDSGQVHPKTGGYSTTQHGVPHRLGYWKNNGTNTGDASEWTECVWNNTNYRAGFWVDPTNTDSIYVVLPANAPSGTDPNDYYMHFAATGSGLDLRADGCRVSGVVFQGCEPAIQIYQADSCVVDHCWFKLNHGYIQLNGVDTTESGASNRTLIERNRWEEEGYYHTSRTVADVSRLGWSQNKGRVYREITTSRGAAGSELGRRLGQENELSAIMSFGQHRLTRIRRNTMLGTFNGINTYGIGKDEWSSFGQVCYENTLERIADDPFEPEGGCMLHSYWANTVRYSLTAISFAPVQWGPIYVFRNSWWQLLKPQSNYPSLTPADGGAEIGIKGSGESEPNPRIFWINNVIWSPYQNADGTNNMDGYNTYDAPFGEEEDYYVRNSIFGAERYSCAWPPTARTRLDSDYSHYYTIDPTRGLRIGDTISETFALHRTRFPQLDAHGTNATRDFSVSIDDQFVDVANGDLTLVAGSFLRAAGVAIPNIADRAGVDYSGTAPNLGSSP